MPQRQTFQGDWQCSECGTNITELPFQPNDDQSVLCRDCYRAKKSARSQGAPRQMFQGDWECAGCGVKITELPFQPDGSRPIYCRDCHQKNRN